ncbi:hypothetical protein LRS37_09260 [Neobacillus sedimentimangrovi]|uniref:Uncharacterized protein n=2 Tax=Neobacillus TaxID=2675232 RepID=A0ABS8QIU0_9BACI|nr:hypothetical protein [Neobacillus sedimentimangrovi]MCD4839058.1 hypothetical protein [Neobacillus sedimentimangrovi]
MNFENGSASAHMVSKVTGEMTKSPPSSFVGAELTNDRKTKGMGTNPFLENKANKKSSIMKDFLF